MTLVHRSAGRPEPTWLPFLCRLRFHSWRAPHSKPHPRGQLQCQRCMLKRQAKVQDPYVPGILG